MVNAVDIAGADNEMRRPSLAVAQQVQRLAAEVLRAAATQRPRIIAKPQRRSHSDMAVHNTRGTVAIRI